jgi:hypothetical protein
LAYIGAWGKVRKRDVELKGDGIPCLNIRLCGLNKWCLIGDGVSPEKLDAGENMSGCVRDARRIYGLSWILPGH